MSGTFFYFIQPIYRLIADSFVKLAISFFIGYKSVTWRLTQTCLLFVCLQANASNTDKLYQFDIPAQPLIKSLATLSESTEHLSLFPFHLIKTKINRPLVGYYTVRQALDILLADTGLEAEILNNDSFMLKPVVTTKNNQGNKPLDIELSAENSEVLTDIGDVELIQVYGSIRQSFEGAIGFKRIADTVVDVITAEEIGQFSDASIAGAIQRIPGVQVETDDSGTQGDRVSIRGLGPEFVNSTINGRRLLSAGTEATSLRQMNFNIFPANVLGGVQVIKGQTASKSGEGLAGQVNLQTLKPLEIDRLSDKTSFASGSFEWRYQDYSNEKGYRANAIVGARNEEKTLGGYLAFVVVDGHSSRDQLRVNSANRTVALDTSGDGNSDSLVEGFFPSSITLNPIMDTPTRSALATGIEYKINQDLNINWDLLYLEYENKSERQSRQIRMGNAYSSTIFNNSDTANPALIIDKNDVVKFIDFSNSSSSGSNIISDIIKSFQYNNKTQVTVTGINIANFINDNFKVNVDVYYSGIDYEQDLRTTNLRKALPLPGFLYDGTGKLAKFSTNDADDIEGFQYLQSTLRPIEFHGDNYGFTVAFNYAFDDTAFITSLDYGIHYEMTDIMLRTTDFYQLLPESEEQRENLTKAILSGDLIAQAFLVDENYLPARWFYSDYAAAVAVDPRIAATNMEDIGDSLTSSYNMSEKVFNLYGQINFETELFKLPLNGNVGLKIDYASQVADAYELLDGVATPVVTQGDYWQYLPSLNLKLDLQEDLILRLGLSKTLTRPEYEQMAPTNIILSPVEDGGIGEATLGNPALDPMTSINTDITLEWYSELEGAFVVSTFYKYISDFVLKQTLAEQEVPGYEGLYNKNTFINYSDGKVQGFEVTFYQPFDKIMPELTGFGISANYTYVDSEFDKDVGDANFGFPGSSEDNFNVIAFYDEDLFSVRLAYVYRSEFFRQLAGTGAQTDSAIFTEAQGKLDLSVIVTASDNLSLRFNASNITEQDRRDFVGVRSTFLEYYDRGRAYSITATYNF